MALIMETLDLEGLHGDDRNVFNEIFNFYYEEIFSFCYNKVDDWHNAEEITLDIFTDLRNKRQNIQDREHLCKLLFTIAAAKVTDQWRDHKRQKIKTSELDDNDHNIPVPLQTNPSLEEVARELDNHILFWGGIALKEMKKLPQQCREVLHMRLIENKKRAEIAEILKISPKTVDSHIAYALKLLKITLLENGYNSLLTILWAVLLLFLK